MSIKEPKKETVQKKLNTTISELEDVDQKVETSLNDPKSKAAVLCEPAVKKSKEDMDLQLERIKKDKKELDNGNLSPAVAEKRLSHKKAKSDQALERIKAQFPDNNSDNE